jgi:hypothetical protein
MAEKAEEAEKKTLDARIQWMRNRLTSSLRCKELVLDRLFSQEDSAAAVAAFIETSDCNRLLVFDAGKGELAAVRSAAPGWPADQAPQNSPVALRWHACRRLRAAAARGGRGTPSLGAGSLLWRRIVALRRTQRVRAPTP